MPRLGTDRQPAWCCSGEGHIPVSPLNSCVAIDTCGKSPAAWRSTSSHGIHNLAVHPLTQRPLNLVHRNTSGSLMVSVKMGCGWLLVADPSAGRMLEGRALYGGIELEFYHNPSLSMSQHR